MKLNLEIELEWLDDCYNLDESIQKKLIESVTNKVCENIKEDVYNKCYSSVNKVISERMNEYMTEFFDTPREITDDWGDVVEKTTIKDKLKKACDSFMEQKVDKNGNVSSGWNTTTRAEYIIKKYVEDDYKREVENACEKASRMIKQKADEIMKKNLGEKLADVVGLTMFDE